MTVDWELAQDVVASVLLLAGSLLTLAAAVGIVRFPDLLTRSHTAAKPQVLGLILLLLGLALRLRNTDVLWVLVLVALFQMLTSPVAAHMVSRAGFRTGKIDSESLVVDELTRDIAEAEASGGTASSAGRADDAASAPGGASARDAGSADDAGGATHREDA